MAMGMATQRLGLGATYSTTYYEPYHVARVFATMDLMLKGRVAWNIVTSLNSGEARNFGSDEHMEHDHATTGPTSSWTSCSATGTPGKTTP